MNIQRFVLGVAALMVAAVAEAEVRLPAFFGDNMVLQQQTDARLWGWATPDKKVTVTPSWNHKSYTTRADKEGRWKIEIPTPEAGGPYAVTISDGEALTLQNVMLGEVWVCSGQSNMEMPMKGFKNQPVENGNMDAAKGTNPNIRLFTVKRNAKNRSGGGCDGRMERGQAPLDSRFFGYGLLLRPYAGGGVAGACRPGLRGLGWLGV